MASSPLRRCAIYTRKSSEEGLEQDYNSLHAQREACEAFIRSQAGEGWKLIKTVYEAIRKSLHWNTSMLIITWDEHGGFYDHVQPPSAVAPTSPSAKRILYGCVPAPRSSLCWPRAMASWRAAEIVSRTTRPTMIASRATMAIRSQPASGPACPGRRSPRMISSPERRIFLLCIARALHSGGALSGRI